MDDIYPVGRVTPMPGDEPGKVRFKLREMHIDMFIGAGPNGYHQKPFKKISEAIQLLEADYHEEHAGEFDTYYYRYMCCTNGPDRIVIFGEREETLEETKERLRKTNEVKIRQQIERKTRIKELETELGKLKEIEKDDPIPFSDDL